MTRIPHNFYNYEGFLSYINSIHSIELINGCGKPQNLNIKKSQFKTDSSNKGFKNILNLNITAAR